MNGEVIYADRADAQTIFSDRYRLLGKPDYILTRVARRFRSSASHATSLKRGHMMAKS